MLNISHYQRNANQNYNEILPHTDQNGHHQKIYKQCWRGYREKGTLLYCWWECKLVQPLWKTVWRFLKKLGIKPPYDMTQQSHSQAYTLRVEKDTCIPLFIAALFTIARTWKQSRCPSTDEWIKKLWCIYTMEYYSVIKRNT